MMPLRVPLPQGVRDLLKHNTHPGLLLDKYVASWDPTAPPGKLSELVQRPTLQAVVQLSQQPPPGFAFPALLERRRKLLASVRARQFACATAGPLTLHLARASALENAGICLHPLYGFVYLPGTGLKGMARAYAKTIWLPAEADQAAGENRIQAVFGNEPGEPRQDWQQVGAVVFHDAWPEEWPGLIVDIVNNHHPEYYGDRPDSNAHPPGDWEDPRPVYFLAVTPNTTFSFALSKRRGDLLDGLLAQAEEWLLAALCHLGAGAKTAAGYGDFKFRARSSEQQQTQAAVVQSWESTKRKKVREEFTSTLELVTPAFLAGADHARPEDCDLRPATLRGLLRWWWRTMHAGFVDVCTLRRMEADVWGDTERGGPVRVVVQPREVQPPIRYDKRSKINMSPPQKASDYGIPGSNPQKTTQGLWYASFGMDETSRGERKQRYYLEPGCSWSLRLIARPPADGLTAQDVLEQARAALWLLCTFGGIGSKARKGFGSLGVDQFDEWNLRTCFEVAARWRAKFNLPTSSATQVAASSALGHALGPMEVLFSWPEVWEVLDQVGFAYQAFAKKYKHKLEKKALGLPHRIGPGVEGSFEPTGPVKKLLDEARRQRKEENVRHASPIHIHVGASPGRLTVRTLAFASPYLPDLQTSRAFLEEFLRDFEDDLRRRAQLTPPTLAAPPRRRHGGQQQRGGAAHSASPRPPEPSKGPVLPKVGDRVEAVLLDEKTKKGGWKAKHTGTGIAGPIQNSAAVPGNLNPGNTVTLVVKSVNSKEIAFAWPS